MTSPRLYRSLKLFPLIRPTSDMCTRPSIPSASSTNRPKSVILVTVPVTRLFTGYCCGMSSQGSTSNCLMPNEKRSLSLSIFRTTACTSSFFLYISDGCFSLLVQEISETCTRPSIPSSIPIKIPKSVMFLIFPSMVVPMGYFSATRSQGFGSTCFIPSEMRLLFESMFRTTHSTRSPTDRILLGFLILRVHDISDTCIRPSTPSSTSMKAP